MRRHRTSDTINQSALSINHLNTGVWKTELALVVFQAEKCNESSVQAEVQDIGMAQRIDNVSIISLFSSSQSLVYKPIIGKRQDKKCCLTRAARFKQATVAWLGLALLLTLLNIGFNILGFSQRLKHCFFGLWKTLCENFAGPKLVSYHVT